MRINLYSMFLAPAVLAAAVFTAQPALAATPSKVQVPFDFLVDGKTLPAGEYQVRHDDRLNTVALEGGSAAFGWITGPGVDKPAAGRVILTFDNFGNTHVLRSVQAGSRITAPLDTKYSHSRDAEIQLTGGEN